MIISPTHKKIRFCPAHKKSDKGGLKRAVVCFDLKTQQVVVRLHQYTASSYMGKCAFVLWVGPNATDMASAFGYGRYNASSACNFNNVLHKVVANVGLKMDRDISDNISTSDEHEVLEAIAAALGFHDTVQIETVA